MDNCLFMYIFLLLIYSVVGNLSVDEKVAELENENVKLRQEMKEMKSHYRHEIEVLQSRLVQLEELVPKLVDKDSDSRDRRLITPTSQTVSSQPPINNTVAFFATMKDHQENLGIHQTIAFPAVVTNEGSGYDPQTSTFKAPVSGVYYFSANVMTWWREDIDVELMKMGVGVCASYIGNGDANAVGTLSAVLRLNAGDDVWIRIFDNKITNAGNVRIYGGFWSWFSGFLISK